MSNERDIDMALCKGDGCTLRCCVPDEDDQDDGNDAALRAADRCNEYRMTEDD